MATRTETYAATRDAPYLLEQGATQTLSCPVRYGADGPLVEPDSGTITVKNPAGESIVSAEAVVVSSSIATYEISASLLPSTETLGEGWTVEWTLVFASVQYPAYRFQAVLCEYVPHCSISSGDLYIYEPELQYLVPQAQRSTSDGGDGTGWQSRVDRVYYNFLNWLITNGRPIWLLRGMTSSKEYLTREALALVCGGLQGSQWAERTKTHGILANRARGSLRLQYSTEDPAVKRGGTPVIRLGAVGRPVW